VLFSVEPGRTPRALDTTLQVAATRTGSFALHLHRRPPASPRVSFVELGSTLEVTAGGIGAGATLAQARRERPGRRRTAFTLFKGVVQDVQIGRRTTKGTVPVTRC
jgi:hypothetical protein